MMDVDMLRESLSEGKTCCSFKVELLVVPTPIQLKILTFRLYKGAYYDIPV